ncbi:hypothetical protein IQ31_00109 [Sphingobacterium siyangense]|uniref:Response regulatory domain-containing protein n=1 Tax=Sphingobacterium siyangense TaxID=459529 RepID=A0A562N079_9SPHI|nr:hypothetical protein IQ31_00109 [Sphingobacterium siyangense]
MGNEKKRILVIEDNEILLSTMQFVLVREGYDLLLARSVMTFCQWLRNNRSHSEKQYE